jgi:hypothetical protein
MFMSERSPNYEKHGKLAVHRDVAAKTLGRTLHAGEVVHHIDGNKRNNAPDNLRVFASQAEHMRHERATNPRVGFTHDTGVTAGRQSGVVRRRHRDT